MATQASPPLRMLIVSYTFPPAGGIGGRRWAKFAKYLNRAGAEVTVISAAANEQGSPWTGDVQGISQVHFKSRFPDILTKNPTSFYAKLAYRAQLLRMKLLSKGSPYDRALLDKPAFLKVLHTEIERFKPDVVIATGAPFRLLAYSASVRSRYPDIAFFADIRDPWTWGEAFGYKQLSKKRLDFERGLEASVITHFDGIWTPSEDIAAVLASRHGDFREKIAVVEHGFDGDEMPSNTTRTNPAGEPAPLKLIYGGTVYHQTIQGFELLADFVANQSGRMHWNIYAHNAGNHLPAYPHVVIHPAVSSQDFFQEAANADWLVLFYTPQGRNSVPTKVLEYAALGKPILLIGEPGELTDFVERNAIGVHAQTAADLAKILFSKFTPAMDPERLASYSFSSITARMLDLIASTTNRA